MLSSRRLAAVITGAPSSDITVHHKLVLKTTSGLFARHGEEGALAWAVAQSAWTRRELAGMLIEVALDHDPDNPTTAEVAELLLRRALAFDPKSDAGYLAIVPTARTSLGSLGIPFVTGSLEQRS